MNILNTIMGKLLPNKFANAQAAMGQPTTSPSPIKADPATAVHPPIAPNVDVEEILRGLERNNSQKLNWRSSIVDLMKMLNMDSDLESRKQLARELQYTGDMNDSAQMNTWLHQQVMKKLEENGGRIPESLKH